MERLARFGWHPLLLIPLIFLFGCVMPYPGFYGNGAYSGYGYPYGNGGYSYGGYPYGYGAPYGYAGQVTGYSCPVPEVGVAVPVPEYSSPGGTYVSPSQQAYLPPDRYNRRSPEGTRTWRQQAGGGQYPANSTQPPVIQSGSGGGTSTPTSGRPVARPNSIAPRANTQTWSPRSGALAARGLSRPALPSANAPQMGPVVQRAPRAATPLPATSRVTSASPPTARQPAPRTSNQGILR
jgi:hypothetical protein